MGEQYGMNDIQRMMQLVSGQSNYDLGDWPDQLRTWLNGIEAKQKPMTIDGIHKVTGSQFIVDGVYWEINHIEEVNSRYIFYMLTPNPRPNITIELNRVPYGPYRYDLIYNGNAVETLTHNELTTPDSLLHKIEAILSMI
jgi:hypothetical protein